MTFRSIHFLHPPEFPPWWQSWLARWRERLPLVETPLVPESVRVNLSTFLLSDVRGFRDSLADARSLARGFASIELRRGVQIEFGDQVNFVNMETGEIVLDGS